MEWKACNYTQFLWELSSTIPKEDEFAGKILMFSGENSMCFIL